MGEVKNAYKIFIAKPDGKTPHGRPRLRWDNNIKMDLRKVGWEGVYWIHLAQDRDRWRGSCEHGNEPSDSIKSGGIS
jgi:hypothetical protein